MGAVTINPYDHRRAGLVAEHERRESEGFPRCSSCAQYALVHLQHRAEEARAHVELNRTVAAYLEASRAGVHANVEATRCEDRLPPLCCARRLTRVVVHGSLEAGLEHEPTSAGLAKSRATRIQCELQHRSANAVRNLIEQCDDEQTQSSFALHIDRLRSHIWHRRYRTHILRRLGMSWSFVGVLAGVEILRSLGDTVASH